MALEFPGSLENLFDGFIAICQRHPGVDVPVRTTEPYGKIPWHERSLKILVETVLCEEGAPFHHASAIDFPLNSSWPPRRMTDSGASRGRSPAGEGRGAPSIFTCPRSLVSGHLTYREFTCTVTALSRHLQKPARHVPSLLSLPQSVHRVISFAREFLRHRKIFACHWSIG
jgi:hypothetical protein